MPRSQGRISVSPTAPLDVLAMLQIGVEQAFTGKMMRHDREGEGGTSSHSPSPSPRQRHRRTDSPKVAPREAWTAEGEGLYSSRPGDCRRVSSAGSRPGTAQKTARSGGCPPAPEMSIEWANQTLFGAEKYTNPKAKRGPACTFRRPTSSRATPHSRPIFVVGKDGQDPRMCVDISAPKRFGSAERTRYEGSWRKATVASSTRGGCAGRPFKEPTAATIRNIGSSGLPSSTTGRASVTGPPHRPHSVNSARPYHRPSSGPSPAPGQRPPLPIRPMSTTPAQRSFCSPTPPPAPACWRGA